MTNASITDELARILARGLLRIIVSRAIAGGHDDPTDGADNDRKNQRR